MRVLFAHFGQKRLHVGGEQIQDLHLVGKSNDCANRLDIGEGCQSVMDGPTRAGNPHGCHISSNDLERERLNSLTRPTEERGSSLKFPLKLNPYSPL